MGKQVDTKGNYILNSVFLTDTGKIIQGSIMNRETNQTYQIGQMCKGRSQILCIDGKYINVVIKYGQFRSDTHLDDIYLELTYVYNNEEFKININKL